jgi:hypothetical protein
MYRRLIASHPTSVQKQIFLTNQEKLTERAGKPHNDSTSSCAASTTYCSANHGTSNYVPPAAIAALNLSHLLEIQFFHGITPKK